MTSTAPGRLDDEPPGHCLDLSRCDLFLVTHTETNKTPRVRVVTDFVGRLLPDNRAAIEGSPRWPQDAQARGTAVATSAAPRLARVHR